MRGIIASDIDRTLTNSDHIIPEDVITYLHSCYNDGFEIVFLTGRTYKFSKKALSLCDFPFHLAVQNGAEVLKMPEEVFCMQRFLTKEMALKIRSVLNLSGRDFTFYSGSAHGDICYYEKGRFSGKALEYVNFSKGYGAVNWVEVDSIEKLDIDHFSLVRTFGSKEEMEELKALVLSIAFVSAVILHDVHKENEYILMISSLGVDKGGALRRLVEHYDWKGVIIACGDDLNDVSMFAEADISIGMENGHPELLKIATIIAKPSYDMGIIDALKQARGMIND